MQAINTLTKKKKELSHLKRNGYPNQERSDPHLFH